MNKLLILLTGMLMVLFNNCTDGTEKISPLELLTNQSSKTWQLLKVRIDISTAAGTTVAMIPLLSCVTDDENIFQADGKYLIDNKGTKYNVFDPMLSDSPSFCKDTADIIENNSWRMNKSMDSLMISSAKYAYGLKILKITTDSLIVSRSGHPPVSEQIEYYVSKK